MTQVVYAQFFLRNGEVFFAYMWHDEFEMLLDVLSTVESYEEPRFTKFTAISGEVASLDLAQVISASMSFEDGMADELEGVYIDEE